MSSEDYQRQIAILSTQLETANRRILQIEADARVDKEIAGEQERMLENRNAALQNKLRKELSKREDAEAERDRLKEQISGFKGSKANDAAEIEDLKKRNSDLDKQRKDDQLKLQQLSRVCKELCHDFREESNALKTVAHKIPQTLTDFFEGTFIVQLQAKADEILTMKMGAFQEENERSNQEKQEQLQKDMEATVREKMNNYDDELQKNQMAINELNEEISAKKGEIDGLNSRIAHYQQNITELEAQVLQSKITSDDVMKSNEQRVQSIEENLEVHKLEIKKLEKDREDIIMGKMRDISALEDQIEQLHIQYDIERRRADTLVDELSKMKQVEDQRNVPVFDPELAMAGMTSIENVSDQVVEQRIGASAEKGNSGRQMLGEQPSEMPQNEANEQSDPSRFEEFSKKPFENVFEANDGGPDVVRPEKALSIRTNGDAGKRNFEGLDPAMALGLHPDAEDDGNLALESEEDHYTKDSFHMKISTKRNISAIQVTTDAPFNDDSDHNQLTPSARLPISVVKSSDLLKAIERDMTIEMEMPETVNQNVSSEDDEVPYSSDIEAVAEQASQMLLALDSIQKRLEALQMFEEFSEDVCSVTHQDSAEWKRDISELEVESDNGVEREARLIIEELERNSKNTPLETQLQLLQVKFDEGKISLQEHKRARVLLMCSQSMIDTEKAEQEVKKTREALLAVREKRAETARTEAQPLLDSTFEALEHITHQSEDLAKRLDDLQHAFSQLVPSHMKATELLNSMSIYVDEVEDQAEQAQTSIRHAMKAEHDAEQIWFQQLRSYDRSLRNSLIMDKFCKDIAQSANHEAAQFGFGNYLSWFYNVK